MSLLLSDSLVGLVDERELMEISYGTLKIGADDFDIDGFLSDGKVIRVQAVADFDDAIRILKTGFTGQAHVDLSEGTYRAVGKVLQVGWERLSHGNRLVVSIQVRDK